MAMCKSITIAPNSLGNSTLPPRLVIRVRNHVPLAGFLGGTCRSYGGSAVPDFDFTIETSEALIEPLTVTSVRKFDPVTGCPDCSLVWLTSVAFTVPFPQVSPSRKPIGACNTEVTLPNESTTSSGECLRIARDCLLRIRIVRCDFPRWHYWR
jgi:hypothetical protein